MPPKAKRTAPSKTPQACGVCGVTKSSAQLLNHHLVQAHPGTHGHLGRYTCPCPACLSPPKLFYDPSHWKRQHQGATAPCARPVPIGSAPIPAAPAPAPAPASVPAPAPLPPIQPLGPYGSILAPDGTLFPAAPPFACPSPGCAHPAFAAAQSLRWHLLDAHTWTSVAKHVCVCPHCAGGRLFVDVRQARYFHQRQKWDLDQTTHLKNPRGPAPDDSEAPESGDDDPVDLVDTDGNKYPVHHDGSKHLCPLCAVKLGTLTTVRKHLCTVHHVALQGSLLCTASECGHGPGGKLFASQALMDAHLGRPPKRRRGDPPRTYACTADPPCPDLVFTHLQKYEAHMASHTGVKLHKCDQCDHAAANTSDLSKHKAAVHVDAPTPCDLCAHVAKNPAALRSHKAAVHVDAGVVPLLTCPVSDCGYQCYFPYRLRRHTEYVHTDARPFVCLDPGCPLLDEDGPCTFKTSRDLADHTAGVHATEFSLPCESCSAVFPTQRRLNTHALAVHGPRRRKCTRCDASFAFPSSLADHEATHDPPTKPCRHCDRMFSTNDSRANHETYTHTHRRKHVCGLCGREETAPWLLDTHVAHHQYKDTRFRSDAERVLYDLFFSRGVLVQQTFVPSGTRLSYDFVVSLPGTEAVTLVEYDGLHHYSALASSEFRQLGFLSQVFRDQQKSRMARASGLSLRRLTGALPADGTKVLDVLGAPVSPDEFADYVVPGAFTSVLAHQLRAGLAKGVAPPETDLALPALLLLSCLRDAGHLKIGWLPAELLLRFRGALAELFLRHCATACPDLDQLRALHGTAACDALCLLAAEMPELNGGGSWGVAAFEPPAPVCVTVVNPYDGDPSTDVATCWLCPEARRAPFRRSAQHDRLLEHLNAVHGAALLVRCHGCSAPFHSFAQAENSLCCAKAGAGYVCGVDSCAHKLVMTAVPTMLRHLDRCHAAQFGQWATLACSDCKFVASGLADLRRHAWEAHGGAAKK